MLSRVQLVSLCFFSVAACSPVDAPEPDERGAVYSELTPSDPATKFDQVPVCRAVVKRHATLQEASMRDGKVRWNCADVPGVTGGDRGQEYCEYRAMQEGRVVAKGAQILANQPAYCVFTSIFQDVKSSSQLGAFKSLLTKELGSADNMNTPSVATGVSVMVKSVNSRSAATGLVSGCAPIKERDTIAYPRMVACYDAAARDPAAKDALRTGCRNVDLSKDTAWEPIQKLGAVIPEESDPTAESFHEVSYCLRAGGNFAVSWRNSDPMICSRVARAAAECKCSFNAVPGALEGLTFTGWKEPTLPAGCRFAKVEGKDRSDLVLCQLTDEERALIASDAIYSQDATQFCRNQYAANLVLELPIEALVKKGTCTGTSTFCAPYVAAAKP